MNDTYSGKSADDFIWEAIDRGMLYRREKFGRYTRITFTRLEDTGEKKMRENKFFAVDEDESIAAEIAFAAATKIK